MIKAPKKLIEVALPLDDINTASAREKSIRHGHPSTLHLWWARRPLAAARAVLFAQLVNDPGGDRGWGRYPGQTKEDAQRERERLFVLIRELVKWENTTNEVVLEQAREEIRRSWRETCELNKGQPGFDPDKLPAFHDPFAGGGSIPLEAQRLGLEAHASDLNPVAVLINKAMIEIPPKFAGRPPVNPEARKDNRLLERPWRGAQGLAEDVRYYGKWMRDEAEKRIGHLYPKVEITPEMVAERPDLKQYQGRKLTVIAWIWARTVKSPNPAYSYVDVPLASTFMLSTKAGKEAYVEPVIEADGYRFTVKVGKPKDEAKAKSGTKVSGSGSSFLCLMSGTPMPFDYLRGEGKKGRIGTRLMAVVVEGERSRLYLSPSKEIEQIALTAVSENAPDQEMPAKALGFRIQEYGMLKWSSLFTPRQLAALTTFAGLVPEAVEQARRDFLGTRASRPRQTWHRTRLPHFEAGQTAQHVTFRLADSLPATILARWKTENAHLSEQYQDAKLRKNIELYLDQSYGSCALRNPRIGQLVQNALYHFHGTRYLLHEWAIMPNHVHVLFTPLHGNSLSSIIHSWKSFTAKEALKLLNQRDTFWHPDYFDRAIRDQKHWETVVAYIRNNPVKAGLCATAEDWEFGSAKFISDIPVDDCDGEDVLTRARRPRSQDVTPLCEGGTGALGYAEAIGVYLAFAVDKMSDRNASICSWDSSRDSIRGVFGRQAIPMVWDFAESNPIGGNAGSFDNAVDQCRRVLNELPCLNDNFSRQADAATQQISNNKIISTDPPYYDNVPYADLSDFFYVWLRLGLKSIYPDLFATLVAPKEEELVATAYRHGGKDKAESFFLDGMTQAMRRLAEQAHDHFPVTIYYAFKQTEKSGSIEKPGNEGVSPSSGTLRGQDALAPRSTGWETFLNAVIIAGFAIGGTWPIRTELGNRMRGMASNALASSIVLVCRKRDPSAPSISRRQFLRELKEELPDALETMIGGKEGTSPIAPVDLAQAAIGPGMAVYSRYSGILEADGARLSVRDALIQINKVIDDYFNEVEGDMDSDTRFCIDWFMQYGFKEAEFGQADVLARAKGTTVDGLVLAGVVESRAGKVRLLRFDEYSADWDPETDARTPTWEALHQLVRALRSGGEVVAGLLLGKMPDRTEAIRQLAYRLYTLCERKGWAEEARAYNELIAAWYGTVEAADQAQALAQAKSRRIEQRSFEL
jgi:putative DNA methylase